MFLAIDLGQRRVAPFLPETQVQLRAAATAHARLPRPQWVGRRLALPAP
jgi:acyl-CoA thioester hydrolase